MIYDWVGAPFFGRSENQFVDGRPENITHKLLHWIAGEEQREGVQNIYSGVQVIPTVCTSIRHPHIFVISQLKWLKFGLQPHLIKMFLHTKFQLSITCTFRVTKLLVEVFSTIL